jgi:hypothetical protein
MARRTSPTTVRGKATCDISGHSFRTLDAGEGREVIVQVPVTGVKVESGNVTGVYEREWLCVAGRTA